ncbi:MAG TPA: ATP-binding protein [Rectinemataceae bacterium]|nr:ATP-binding protein [Rectinemataceae bacterium]
MAADSISDILLTGFADADRDELAAALGGLGRTVLSGDPINDPKTAFVVAAAYDETALRSMRAAALEDVRPWCFVVPAGDRHVVAAAAAAREGRVLLLPVELRELKRVLGALAEDARERSAGGAAFAGLRSMKASFAWKTRGLDVSRICRSLAHLLAECGYYSGPGAEDECTLALEEALVNAVEHGNLELDSSLRPDDPLKEDLYELEREKRLADPAFGDRLISVELSVEADQAALTIEDQGPGFDTSAVDDRPSTSDVSGKGFWLIKRPFDDARYNASGNRLTLTKHRPQP